MRHFNHTHTYCLVQVENHVDKKNFERQKGVGSMFNQFGGVYIGDNDWRIQRAIKFQQPFPRLLAFHANDNAVRVKEVTHRRVLPQGTWG